MSLVLQERKKEKKRSVSAVLFPWRNSGYSQVYFAANKDWIRRYSKGKESVREKESFKSKFYIHDVLIHGLLY